MPYTDVYRDGFSFGFDRFFYMPGHTERVEPETLRDMFLPKLTPEAKKKLRDSYDFVASQLKHYGVDYSEKELTGQGTNFLKKMLAAGKLIEKHFLDTFGRPDRTKTTEVLVVPLPPGSTYRVSKVIDAAKKVSGLHYDNQCESLYIGWDQVAVTAAAGGHRERIRRQRAKEKNDRDQERNSRHSEYLRKARAKHVKGYWSPVGSFIVDCDAIKDEWPDSANDMTLDLSETDQPGIFGASFDFGILEGVMMLSSNKTALKLYCDQLEREDMWDDEEYSGDEGKGYEDGEESATGSKRKATAKRNKTSKKQRVQDGNPRKLFLRWKGAETGEGQILHEAEEGSITFKDAELSAFTGKMDISFVGRNVSFTARKVSESTRGYGSWNDFSFSAYEHARVSRWR
ncbi:hypothetical protein F4818DRAFT_444888 [Hypoxylon cercidicola]|nr:hypothetical protein F4818DRAFT_444888 [Hypoxylon cercidicola]